MNLANLVKSLLNIQKEINVGELPSMGLFYNDDFKISIKKADLEDIIEYEYKWDNDVASVISRIKKLVKKNIVLDHGYSFGDIKSVDVIYLFLEIVKFTKGEPIFFVYIDSMGDELKIEFCSENFNYFKLDSNILEKYNADEKCFNMNGWKYTLPSIGVEDSLTEFLLEKAIEGALSDYNSYFYEFTHFSSNKNSLSFGEIDNLIQIFNFDISSEDLKTIKKIISTFYPIQKYSLRNKSGKIIDLNQKLNLEKIWK
jgi:hypothetical protein